MIAFLTLKENLIVHKCQATYELRFYKNNIIKKTILFTILQSISPLINLLYYMINLSKI